MSAWSCRSIDGKAAHKIVPPRPRIPCWKGPGADSEEKQELASDIDIAVVDSLKVLDPKRPIREADIRGVRRNVARAGRSFLFEIHGHRHRRRRAGASVNFSFLTARANEMIDEVSMSACGRYCCKSRFAEGVKNSEG